MRCRLCRERAGWWRRCCAPCARLWAAWRALPEAGWGELLEAFAATSATPAEVDRFLDAAVPRGGPRIRDQITASLANQLLAALGRPATQTGDGVRRLRERGAWRSYDQRPE
jgi:hypothetical protein